MSNAVNKDDIYKHLISWEFLDNKDIIKAGEAYKVTIKKGIKSVIITMPYEVGEFFLDFYIDEKPYYSDWFEIMDDPLPDFMSYTKQVVENYLFNEVRIQTVGWWPFKTDELQYFSKGEWLKVFDEAT